MPAVIIGRPPQKNEAIYSALKTHIIRERQKKKQEQEADAENERQRKERERQQKQDVMTLGETREQISQLEQKLGQLKDEKHQLFLQLKKVLNEDDNRRRQLVKESNEVMEMYAYPGVSLGNPQIFLQQNIPIAGRNTLYKVPAQHTLLPGGTLKRRRSPSPPNASGYHSQYTYKPGAAPSAYQKVDDNRRAPEYFRAVLWNKNSQYGPYFPAPATTMQVSTGKSQAIYTYPGQHYTQPTGSSSTQQQRESNNQESPVPPPKSLYMPQARPHSSQPYLHVTIDQKSNVSEDNFYSSQIRPANHVPLQGGGIPIHQPPQGAKTGGITSGSPIRPPASVPPPYAVMSSTASHNVSINRIVHSQAKFNVQPSSSPPARYCSNITTANIPPYSLQFRE